MNGEVFTLADHYHPDHPLKLIDGPEIECAWLEPQRGEIKPPRGRTAFGLAYAITVHKSQGCEFKAVVLALSMQHFVLLRRNLLYTALTRAKRLLVVVGTQRALRTAVEMGAAEQRASLLERRLRAGTAA
jgi:hypothetical protein